MSREPVLSVVGIHAAFTCIQIFRALAGAFRSCRRLRRHRDLVERLILGRAALFDGLQAISAGLDLPGSVAGDGRVWPD